MKPTFLIIIFLFLTQLIFAQDAIIKNNGDEINGKVTEVTATEIKYKKADNSDVTYSIAKTEVFIIKYANGTKDVFTDKSTTSVVVKDTLPVKSTVTNTVTTKTFSEITKKGSKVYIDCSDEAVIIHATNYMEKWGYWTIIKQKSEADFILTFYVKHGFWNGWEGYVEFTNPVTGFSMKQTQTEYMAAVSADMNGKRNCVQRIIKKRIKPLFK